MRGQVVLGEGSGRRRELRAERGTQVWTGGVLVGGSARRWGRGLAGGAQRGLGGVLCLWVLHHLPGNPH